MLTERPRAGHARPLHGRQLFIPSAQWWCPLRRRQRPRRPGPGRRDLPAFGTTHTDYFYGSVPCTRELTPGEIDEDYEKNTGKVIIETFQNRGIDPVHVPGVLCASHGPFTWGKDAAQAVYHAVVLEEVARMAILTLTIDPDAQPAPQHVLDKHFMRKHGPNAYYGQK